MSVEMIDYVREKENLEWNYDALPVIREWINTHSECRLKYINAGKYNHRQFNWLYVSHKNNSNLQCGWKLHVSASIFNAREIIEAVLPILFKLKVNFKVAHTLDFLAYLNENHQNKRQVGKYITVYPDDAEKAVQIAHVLHNCTKEFNSPKIVTDKQFRPGSIIYYRFGSFLAEYVQSLWGGLMPIMLVNGKKEFDFKNTNADFIKDLTDPFTTDENSNLEPDHQCDADPKTIKLIYIEYACITRTESTELILCIDIKSKRRCIIKRAVPNISSDLSGQDAVTRVKIEETILRKLQNKGVSPAVYDSFFDEDGRYCLVMEDIPGSNLHDYLKNRIFNQKPISIKRMVKWAKALASIMLTIHEQNIIHADLKLGNIILHDDKITLIDFDSASDQENNIVCACGSLGFTTKNRDVGKAPVVQDDIFGFGAILYYLFGFVNPNVCPLEVDQAQSSLAQLNPKTPKYILHLVEACLSGNFKSFYEIVKYINGGYRIAKLQSENHQMTEASLQNKLDFLLQSYVNRAYDPSSMKFDFDETVIGEIVLSDFRGLAGSLLALSVASIAKNDSQYHSVINQCAQQLLDQELFYNKIPGLYVGESGKALALLYASFAVKENSLSQEAKKYMHEINQLPLQSVDIFNGTAGRIRVNLIFWVLTQDERFFRAAQNQVEYIVQNKISTEKHIGWYNPTLESTPDNMQLNKDEILLGYAHGIAGIGDALLDYYLVTKEASVLVVLREIIDTLMNSTQRAHADKSLLWSDKLNGSSLLSCWCHGGAGIAVFICRCMHFGICESEQSIVKKLIHPIINFTRGTAPILCHGSAGNLECLLDIRRYFPTEILKEDINNFESILSIWLRTYLNNNMKTANVQMTFYGYITGLAGIISLYTRLSLQDIPNPLHLEFAQYLKEKR